MQLIIIVNRSLLGSGILFIITIVIVYDKLFADNLSFNGNVLKHAYPKLQIKLKCVNDANKNTEKILKFPSWK